jgi:hypothetical protein
VCQGFANVVGDGRLLKQELGARGSLVELPGIGHAAPVKNPVACAEALLEYMRRDE